MMYKSTFVGPFTFKNFGTYNLYIVVLIIIHKLMNYYICMNKSGIIESTKFSQCNLLIQKSKQKKIQSILCQ
ncbi:hypothetical protein CUM97_11090 [Enterococcus mundtii]|nr:hypothetical protein CUM97_11090 [Enterococcus mundtii]